MKFVVNVTKIHPISFLFSQYQASVINDYKCGKYQLYPVPSYLIKSFKQLHYTCTASCQLGHTDTDVSLLVHPYKGRYTWWWWWWWWGKGLIITVVHANNWRHKQYSSHQWNPVYISY